MHFLVRNDIRKCKKFGTSSLEDCSILIKPFHCPYHSWECEDCAFVISPVTILDTPVLQLAAVFWPATVCGFFIVVDAPATILLILILF